MENSKGRTTKRKPPASKFCSKKNKRKRKSSSVPVTPIATLSSPKKNRPPLKINTVDSAKTAIVAVLESLFEDSSDRVELLQSLISDCGGNQKTQSALAVVDPSFSISTKSQKPAALKLPKPVQLNFRAFSRTDRKDDSSRKHKNRLVDSLESFIESLGTPDQQLLVLYEYWRYKKTSNPLGQALLESIKCDRQQLEDLGLNIVENLKDMFKLVNDLNTNNQVKSLNTFQRSLMMAIAPTELPNDESMLLKAIQKSFGLSKYRATKLLHRGVSDRKAVVGGNNHLILPSYERRRNSRYTQEVIAKLHSWLYNDCDSIVVSPHSKDTKLVPDVFTGVKVQQQKYFYKDGVADILLEAAKPVSEGGFDGPRNPDGQLLLSDTMLRAMLPLNLSKLTNSQMDLCACEDCFIPKKQLEALYVFSSRWIRSQMQSPTANEADVQAVTDFLFEDFPNRKRRFDSAMSLLRVMTCAPVVDDCLFPMRCCLGRCSQCPDLDVPPPFLDTSDSAPRIPFVTFDYHSFCKKHKTIAGAPTKCPDCCHEDQLNKKLFFRKKHVTNNNEAIGTFIKDFFLPCLVKYRYHIEHVILLGKNYCVGQRLRTVLSNPGCFHVLRDFMDPLTATFAGQFQSTHFGENAKINMEGLALRYGMKDQVVSVEDSTYEWHGMLADHSRQDSRTVHANTDRLLSSLKMRPDLDLLTEASHLMEQSDGAGKQYRNGNACKLMAATACKYRIHINKMITAPHHGKGDADSQGGVDKTELRKKFRDPATFGVDSEGANKISSATVGSDGKRISLAAIAKAVLSDERRNKGKVGYGLKHRKREANYKFNHRFYHHIDTGMGDTEANTDLQIVNTSFKAVGYPNSKEKYTGMNAHYQFYSSFELGPDVVASRRIPCSCKACASQLFMPWEKEVPAKEQPRFKTPTTCDLSPALAGCNDWLLLSLVPVSLGEVQKQEVETLYEGILSEMEANIASNIEVGQFGAYMFDSNHDYYVVRWSSPVMPYTEELGDVEGTQAIEPGAAVVKGYYFENPGRARQWYIPSQPEKEMVFRVRYVAFTGITMETTEEKRFPLGSVAKRDRSSVLEMEPLRVADADHESIIIELTRRAAIDYEEDAELVASDVEDGEETESDEDSVGHDNQDDY